MYEKVAQYRALTDDQRLEARELAKSNLIKYLGGAPKFESFLRAVPSRFGPDAERFANISVWIVLTSAYLISSVHIFSVGQKTYMETGQKTDLRFVMSIIVALGLVFLSESACIALSVAPTVWGANKSLNIMFGAGVVGSAFIATIGNIDSTILYSNGPLDWAYEWWNSLLVEPVKWALATLPPFLTILVGQILKHRMLSQSEARHEAKIKFEEAQSRWELIASNLEHNGAWEQFWANALWDVWAKGKKRTTLAEITNEEKILIVQREMSSENWFKKIKHEPTVEKPKREERIPVQAQGLSSKEKARTFIKNNPEILEKLHKKEITQSELAEAAGVSPATISRIVSSNGFHQED